MLCRTLLSRTISNFCISRGPIDFGGITGIRAFLPICPVRNLSDATGIGNCPKMRACRMEPSAHNTEASKSCEDTANTASKSKDEYYVCRPTPPCKTGRIENCKPQQAPLIYTWIRPKHCCDDPCPDAPPRFDALFWRPSDKSTRQYQQTWVECPRINIRPRKVCCFEEIRMPPICRRERHESRSSGETACAFSVAQTKCKQEKIGKCPRFKMPCCREARNPPTCRRKKKIEPCQLPCCPYPSYSECCRACPKPARPIECNCTDAPSLCEVLQYLNRKKKYNLPPPLNKVKWS